MNNTGRQRLRDELSQLLLMSGKDIKIMRIFNVRTSASVVLIFLFKRTAFRSTHGQTNIAVRGQINRSETTSVVFGTMMYGYQYSNEQITLGQYVASMSEVLIREGLPTGVGFIVSRLPIMVPHADKLARDATLYLISVAYGDKSGEEIEKEEDMVMEDAEEALPER